MYVCDRFLLILRIIILCYMPTNKNAQLRYQVLDRCFGDFSRKYEIEDLLEEVNEKLYDLFGDESTIKERQLREDIKYMRERIGFNAPIKAYKYDGKKCYYRYEDSDFSIFKNELSIEELQNLRSTIDVLGRFRGISNNVWLEEVISSLEYRFGIKSNKENVISFEHNDDLKGLEFLSEIIDATVNHQALEIHYLSFKGRESVSVIHPYHVKQFNNRWFLFGMEEYRGEQHIANRALDRILKVSVANVPFVKNTFVDFSTHFNNIIGVTHPKDDVIEEVVVLRFDDKRFPYVLNKPIHPTQQVIDSDTYTLSITVRPNKELESRIFSYGPQVEVISPQWFREQIAEKISENMKKYFPMQNACTEEG